MGDTFARVNHTRLRTQSWERRVSMTCQPEILTFSGHVEGHELRKFEFPGVMECNISVMQRSRSVVIKGTAILNSELKVIQVIPTSRL